MDSSSPKSGLERIATHRRIVLLTDGFSTPFLAKTAINLLRYRTEDIAAVLDASTSATTAAELFGVGQRIPVVGRLEDAPGSDALYVGIAPPGGHLPVAWKPIILQGISLGLDIVSGLHEFLIEDTDYTDAATRSGSTLIDVRRNTYKQVASAKGLSDRCVRIHTVGQDCSLGKMVTALEVQLGLAALGHDARFLATGQTGIMVSGRGVPIDCVVADFVNGAIEQWVLAEQSADFELIEGQGSVTHPAYSAVTLGLLHGAAPDGLIYCYEAGRTHVKGFDHVALPPIAQQMQAILQLANLRHPAQWIGVAVNTRNLDSPAARDEIKRANETFQLPACDVYRDGPRVLIEAAVQLRETLLRKRSAKPETE